jgi:hypothetical protein
MHGKCSQNKERTQKSANAMKKKTTGRCKSGKPPSGMPAWAANAVPFILTGLACQWSKWLFENPTTAPIVAHAISAAILVGLGFCLCRLMQTQ